MNGSTATTICAERCRPPIPWQLPGPLDGIGPEKLLQIQELIRGENYRVDPRSPRWVGGVVADVLGFDIEHEDGRSQIKDSLKAMLDAGALKSVGWRDERRHLTLAVAVGKMHAPTRKSLGTKEIMTTKGLAQTRIRRTRKKPLFHAGLLWVLGCASPAFCASCASPPKTDPRTRANLDGMGVSCTCASPIFCASPTNSRKCRWHRGLRECASCFQAYRPGAWRGETGTWSTDDLLRMDFRFTSALLREHGPTTKPEK